MTPKKSQWLKISVPLIHFCKNSHLFNQTQTQHPITNPCCKISPTNLFILLVTTEKQTWQLQQFYQITVNSRTYHKSKINLAGVKNKFRTEFIQFLHDFINIFTLLKIENTISFSSVKCPHFLKLSPATCKKTIRELKELDSVSKKPSWVFLWRFLLWARQVDLSSPENVQLNCNTQFNL